jgi:hypothetical protein
MVFIDGSSLDQLAVVIQGFLYHLERTELIDNRATGFFNQGKSEPAVDTFFILSHDIDQLLV